jgi:hypothetical protein
MAGLIATLEGSKMIGTITLLIALLSSRGLLISRLRARTHIGPRERLILDDAYSWEKNSIRDVKSTSFMYV